MSKMLTKIKGIIMKKLISNFSVFALLFCVSAYSWAGPCMPIAAACKMNGYVKGGEKEGKGLIKDCVMPIVMGTKTLPKTNFTDEQRQQCKAKISEKMKNKM